MFVERGKRVRRGDMIGRQEYELREKEMKSK